MHGSASTANTSVADFPKDFMFFPNFFNLSEQHTLLRASLHKLDALENRALCRRRKDFLSMRSPIPETAQTVEDFLSDQYYDFHEVRQLTLSQYIINIEVQRRMAIATASQSVFERLTYLHGGMPTLLHCPPF